MSNVKERVERGAAWLDVNYPGWHTKIDLSILDMGNCNMCVLGQVYTGVIPTEERGQILAQVLASLPGMYSEDEQAYVEEHVEEYAWLVKSGEYGGYQILTDLYDGELADQGEHHGFVTSDYPDLPVYEAGVAESEEYAQLLDEWTRVIVSRRLTGHNVRELVAA